MNIRKILVVPLIVLWGLLTIVMVKICPQATLSLLKHTAEKAGAFDV